MNSESQKTRVSLQAFLEEVHNWDLTLAREHKKLKSLRPAITTKIHLNLLDIILTQIEAELIQYRKLSDPKKISANQIIQQYNASSRKFMDIMEAIGSFSDKISEGEQNNTLDLEEPQLQSAIGRSMQPAPAPKYHDETFTYAISKSQKVSNKSGVQSRKQSQKKLPSHKNSFSKPNKSLSILWPESRKQEPKQDLDSWEIKYQLKEIKSMMSQIKNQIKFHNHEDMESELAKIQHNNKKMGLELKSLREDSQYALARMQKLKQQLNVEKQIQSQMIQEFENPQKKSRASRGKVASETHNWSGSEELRSQEGRVSDWVRVRI